MNLINKPLMLKPTYINEVSANIDKVEAAKTEKGFLEELMDSVKYKYDIVNDCFKIAKIEGSKERKTNRYTFRMNQFLDINEKFYRENQTHF
jgi:hypothetical protein